MVLTNGVVNVYKEEGYTSFDVVAKLKGILHERKIGHTGTLDPMATGVLPICAGNATGLCALLTDKDKTYTAGVRLGIKTDTLDITGEVIKDDSDKAALITAEDFTGIMNKFIGEISQVPPMYSALKVNGKRLYDYAREGIEVERKSRNIVIHDIKLLDFNDSHAVISVSCSKGTYIRTLIDDIGDELGCGACMDSLIRTESGDFTLDSALKLSEIEEMSHAGDLSFLTPVEHVLAYPSYTVRDEYMKPLSNGNKLQADAFSADIPKLYDGLLIKVFDTAGDFAAVYKYIKKDNIFKTEKMFKRYN